MRHKWEKVHDHKSVCVQCGIVKLHIPHLGFHRTQFERMGKFWDSNPGCDGVFPEGWKPERAKQPK